MATEDIQTLAPEEQNSGTDAQQTAKDESNKSTKKKKKAETPETAETAKTAEAEETAQPEQPVSPWNEMLDIKLPKASKTEQNFQFVSVNGRVFQVPKGKTVKVPRPVYEVLKNKEKAEDEADSFSSEAEISE